VAYAIGGTTPGCEAFCRSAAGGATGDERRATNRFHLKRSTLALAVMFAILLADGAIGLWNAIQLDEQSRPASYYARALVANGIVILLGTGIAGLLYYSTARELAVRRRAQRNAAFLAGLGGRLVSVIDPEKATAIAVREIGEFFGLDYCALEELDREKDRRIVHFDHHPGLPSMQGEYPLSSLPPAVLEDLRNGQATVVSDTQSDPRTAGHHLAAYAPRGIRSFVSMPYVRDGELVAKLLAAARNPRRWRDDEIELLQAVSGRVWLTVENGRLMKHLKETADELSRSNQDLEQFAYVASHDLQEPLRMVTGFVQLLQKRYQGALDASADQYIDYAVDGAKRMQELINDLLSYSRVGTRAREAVPTEAGQMLDRALANLAASIHETGAEIRHGALPKVRADGAQLVQLFQNLIGNAIKFRGDRAPKVTVDARRDDGQWLFRVEDNGIGIDPEYKDRIFLVFQRLHSRREYPGTGIGLAICKKIVDRHGGRIWVESQAGRGATFCFTLPA
jgi:signal transduction histidine kinase